MKKYNIIANTDHGAIIVNKNDLGLGKQLIETSTWQEANLVIQLCNVIKSLGRNDLLVLDIGANIGLHAISYAAAVGNRGKVLAFEAQRIIYYMLAGNVAINSLNNVYCYNKALGASVAEIAIPQFDYGESLSFGSVEFSDRQIEPIGQIRGEELIKEEFVELISIDSLSLSRLDYIKLDVEGMEQQVLEGGLVSINKYNPVIFVEFFKSDINNLASLLIDAGYVIFWNHQIFGANWLCVHKSSSLTISGCQKITNSTDAVTLCSFDRPQGFV